MAEMAPDPGENEMAQEAAKKASQVESVMAIGARTLLGRVYCPRGYFDSSAGRREAPALRVVDGADVRRCGSPRLAAGLAPAAERGALALLARPASRRPPWPRWPCGRGGRSSLSVALADRAK